MAYRAPIRGFSLTVCEPAKGSIALISEGSLLARTQNFPVFVNQGHIGHAPAISG